MKTHSVGAKLLHADGQAFEQTSWS